MAPLDQDQVRLKPEDAKKRIETWLAVCPKQMVKGLKPEDAKKRIETVSSRTRIGVVGEV